MKHLAAFFITLFVLGSSAFAQSIPDQDRLFVHLKTSLDRDDAQICCCSPLYFTGNPSD